MKKGLKNQIVGSAFLPVKYLLDNSGYSQGYLWDNITINDTFSLYTSTKTLKDVQVGTVRLNLDFSFRLRKKLPPANIDLSKKTLKTDFIELYKVGLKNFFSLHQVPARSMDSEQDSEDEEEVPEKNENDSDEDQSTDSSQRVDTG